MADADAVFAALADPTRRGIYRELASGRADTASALARTFPITRQAVSKHLAALAEAGLVESQRSGRETRYRPTPAPLEDVTAWMAEVGALWDARLVALQRLVSS
ncbi:MAG TPA: metalloregulator ArsR/SmtB family transcription factor [Gaiellales bacterium]